MNSTLFSALKIGNMELKNRVVMAPMTRCRAVNNIPNDIMAKYYSQRATAGLIVTEGTAPCDNGLGYARIPGLYTPQHVEGWKKVTGAVHKNGGKIFVQLMHTGRASSTLNMEKGTKILAPSAVRLTTELWTDSKGMQPCDTPSEMSALEIKQTIADFVKSAEMAMQAGFDGVEIHGANGYLVDQFLNASTNKRTDNYGGSPEKRCQFLLEVTKAMSEKIGSNKLGVRMSPFGKFNDVDPMGVDEKTYEFIAKELQNLNLCYLHLMDQGPTVSQDIKMSTMNKMRKSFTNCLILAGGYTAERATQAINDKMANAVAFGAPFIANPTLVEKLKTGAALTAPKTEMFYTPSEEGYCDYI
jgi:N-ethylmaleimide reductase